MRGNVTTYYIGSMYEEEVALGGGDVPEAPDITTTRSMYMFNGQVVAQRSVGPTNTLIYLHSDHLGSVGASTTSAGASLSSQEYDPWGRVRTGGVTQTKYNYTGQKLDDTGLLFYNARYYNPLVGRFTSPDSIVPGASSGLGGAGGTVGAEQNSKLTVDFHDGGFLSSVREENALTVEKGFWFQLSAKDRSDADPSGPINSQSLNRYSYALNNPLRYIDPSGHSWYLSKADGQALVQGLRILANSLRDVASGAGTAAAVIAAITTFVTTTPGLGPAVAAFLQTIAGKIAATVAAYVGLGAFFLWLGASNLATAVDNLATVIGDHIGEDGVALGTDGLTMHFLNRSTGTYSKWDPAPLIMFNTPSNMALAAKNPLVSANGKPPIKTWHFKREEPPWACPASGCPNSPGPIHPPR